MNVSDMSKPSETDWKRVNEMTDEGIDTSDIPTLVRTSLCRRRFGCRSQSRRRLTPNLLRVET